MPVLERGTVREETTARCLAVESVPLTVLVVVALALAGTQICCVTRRGKLLNRRTGDAFPDAIALKEGTSRLGENNASKILLPDVAIPFFRSCLVKSQTYLTKKVRMIPF